MGYDTYFSGELKFNKKVDTVLASYINKFCMTRRMKRDNDIIKSTFPNWKELCFRGELGEDGEYFVGGTGDLGQGHDASIINFNESPSTQPGLWCDWEIINNTLSWNGSEKFYDYTEWLEYLIDNFFEPNEYKLNGDIYWEGEDSDDFGMINVVDNVINVQFGTKVYKGDESEKEFIKGVDDDILIKELKRRGYVVDKWE